MFLFGNSLKSNRSYGLPRHTNFVNCSPLFDGIDDKAVHPNIAAYNSFIGIGAVDYTLSGWFYVSGSTGQSQCIFSTDQGTMGNGFMATWQSSGKFVFQVRSVQCVTDEFISTGRWHHFIIKKISGTSTSNFIKIDGIKKKFTVTGPTNELLAQNTQITVGALAGATGPSTYRAFFKGYVDDLYWFDRVTTDIEDEILFNDFFGGFPLSLANNVLFSSKFDEVDGVNIIDSSPNNNTGTISNMTETTRPKRFSIV